MKHFIRIVLSLAGMLLVTAAVAETFRCGQWIASPDMSVEELLEKCGSPTSKTVEEIDVYGPAVSGSGRVKRGTSTVEKWTYDRGSQSFAMVVTIVDGEIKGMDRSE
ncbi:MAG TPA: DUF2845 domain-containing protein [Steroidobacteraceae bacterium]